MLVSLWEETLIRFQSMVIAGGSAHGRELARAFAARLRAWRPEEGDTAGLAAELERLGAQFRQLRPSMAPVLNVLDTVRQRANEAVQAHLPVEAWAPELADRLEAYASASEARVAKVGMVGARLIPRNGTVMIHSYSGCVASVLRTAAQERRFEVVITESRPLFETRRWVATLAELGIPITVVTDASMETAIAWSDMVLVGADAILADGSVVNKMGTCLLSLAARYHGIPFYVAAESDKLYPPSAAGQVPDLERRPAEEVIRAWRAMGWEPPSETVLRVVNQFFDITPPGLITGLVTEEGILSPAAVHTLRGGASIDL